MAGIHELVCHPLLQDLTPGSRPKMASVSGDPFNRWDYVLQPLRSREPADKRGGIAGKRPLTKPPQEKMKSMVLRQTISFLSLRLEVHRPARCSRCHPSAGRLRQLGTHVAAVPSITMAMNQTVTRDSPLNNSRSIAVPLIVYSVSFSLVIIVVVAMRFYVRLGIIQKVGNDDIALGLTLVRFPGIWPGRVCPNPVTRGQLLGVS